MEIDDMMMLTGNNENKGLTAEQKAALQCLLDAYEKEICAVDAYCQKFECDLCPMRNSKKQCPVTKAKRLSKYLERVVGGLKHGH